MRISPKLLVFPLLILTFNFESMSAPVNDCTSKKSVSAKKPKLDQGPRCQLRFSEIKLARSIDEDIYPFIELKPNCVKRPGPAPKNPLESYKLIILEDRPHKFSFVADFANYPYDESKQFVVVGSPKQRNVDISLGTTHVFSSFSTTVHSRMLPLLGEGSYAILLLRDIPKNEGKHFNLWYKLDGTMQSKIVTTQQLNLIKKHVVDMVVIGSEDEMKRTNFLEFWKQIDPSCQMFTNSWNDYKNAALENSLNICNDEYKGFDSSSLKVGPESPGEQNNCGTSPQNEDVLDSLEDMLIENSPLECQPLCHVMGTSQILSVQQAFNPGFIETCKHFFPKGDTTTQISSIQEWLRFQTDPMCKFYCNACNSYFDSGFRPDLKKKSKLMKGGYYSTNIYSNRDAIRNHADHKVHQEAMIFYHKIKAAEDEEKRNLILAEFEEAEKTLFNSTMNVVLFVYAEMKSGLSFKTHETLMKALRLMGANVGWLQHTNDASQGFTKITARTLHNDLLKKLVASNQPFAILADSSTTSNQPFLAVYFQTIDNKGIPTTYFYSLIHMAQGEKARDMVNSPIDQIKSDSISVEGFEAFFKSRLSSISSDGASVMTGKVKSFRVYLIEYIGRPIPHVICLAHNLDRSYKVGIRHDPKEIKAIKERIKKKPTPTDMATLWQWTYFEEFDKFLKKLYTYYQSRGHKKWQHLLRSADELEEIPKSMKYPFDIRWSETLYESILAVHHNHYTLVYGVDEISEDDDFEDSAQDTAIEIHQRLTDKTFLFAMHDLLDILATYKKASKLFQTANSIVTGKVGIVYEILDSLTNLKDSPGQWLQDFLQHVACTHVCDEGDCTLSEVDSCEDGIIRGMTIQHQYPVALPYAEVRNIVLSSLLSSMKKYFKLEMLEAFEVFNPSRLAFQTMTDCEDSQMPSVPRVISLSLEDLYHVEDSHKKHHIYTSYKQRLDYICKFYYLNSKINCEQLSSEWTNLLACIISTEELINLKSTDATVFWPKSMTVCSSYWTPGTRDLIQLVLVTSYTSSECERGFSIMNAIKTKARSKLDKSTVDAIMKVKINGPDLEDFPTYKMTVEILKVYARVDDPEFPNTRGAVVSKT